MIQKKTVARRLLKFLNSPRVLKAAEENERVDACKGFCPINSGFIKPLDVEYAPKVSKYDSPQFCKYCLELSGVLPVDVDSACPCFYHNSFWKARAIAIGKCREIIPYDKIDNN